MLRIIFVMLTLSMLTACVTPLPLDQQIPNPEYVSGGKVLVTVIDQRKRVKEGKEKTFVGVAHSTFGIPVDWHVKHALATVDGDKERDLSAFLEHRIVSGLASKGWKSEAIDLSQLPENADAKSLLSGKGASALLAIELHEWYFSVNLNWVSDFNFDTDADVHVYQVQNGEVLKKKIAERDVIVQSGSESYQNSILRAYKAQLAQILNDPEVRAAIAQQ